MRWGENKENLDKQTHTQTNKPVNKHTHMLRSISCSISSRSSCSPSWWGLNRGDAQCYRTQRWFVLGTPQLSDLMSCSESWQLGPAKVTAAFARGPAHFRSCLAKLCSTWWLVRSHKSTTSSTTVQTHTLPGNGGWRADGVTLTTPEINSWLLHQLSRWLMVCGSHRFKHH